MLKKNDNLITARGLNPRNLSWEDILDDNLLFLKQTIASLRIQKNTNSVCLPAEPGYEIHPYKQYSHLKNFHKYIIGTFPPISYLYDTAAFTQNEIGAICQPNWGRKIPRAQIPYYHGNKGLMFDYLLTEEEQDQIPENRLEARLYLINLLLDQQINYADIIDAVQRNTVEDRYNGRDENLNNIIINQDLINHILANPCAETILFNTGSIYSVRGMQFENNGKVNVEKCGALDLFLRALQELDLDVFIEISFLHNHVPFQPLHNLQFPTNATKLIFDLTISKRENREYHNLPKEFNESKKLRCITPFSPAVARRSNLLAGNTIVQNYLRQHPKADTKKMLADIYQKFRHNTTQDFYTLNN
jgi:hypothetical protein